MDEAASFVATNFALIIEIWGCYLGTRYPNFII